MIETIDAVLFGGPYDGLQLHVSQGPSLTLEVRGSGGTLVKRDVYALEATVEGAFRFRHIGSQERE